VSKKEFPRKFHHLESLAPVRSDEGIEGGELARFFSILDVLHRLSKSVYFFSVNELLLSWSKRHWGLLGVVYPDEIA
jgi:hypothetical protein